MSDYNALSEEQKDKFIELLCGFVLLDNAFSDDEEAFISNLLSGSNTPIDRFYEKFEELIDKPPKEICENALVGLAELSRVEKEWVLETLYELSLADEFLHVEEKGFLDNVNRYWGLQVYFGKGRLNWTEQQSEIIQAEPDARFIVNAMPGAGKTAVACAKISNLIDEGVTPSNIWLVSFTRTAVQELRDRISSFADEEDDIIGVKIATIDSRAWQLRYGMRSDENKSLFDDYDLSISNAIDMLDEYSDELEDFFSDLEHVIIDEAQDITGVRLAFIEKIIEKLPPSCGISIFGDDAQAIYGFTNDNTEIASADSSENLMGLYKFKPPVGFEYRELQSMHRTENQSLLALIDTLRLQIQVEEPKDVIAPKDTAKAIKEAADQSVSGFDAKALHGLNNTLILFRKRSDVLQACSFANQQDLKYRVRMSGMPIVCRPWIGQLFYAQNAEEISKSEFFELWKDKEHELVKVGDTQFSAVKRLEDYARKGPGHISLKNLRNQIAMSVPPVGLCVSDLGEEGPTIGTIHASKGRQAQNVTLFLGSTSKSGEKPEAEAEETRVLFVGASRAETSLSVGPGFRSFSKSLSSGRTFVPNRRSYRKNAAQVEIGRAGDFDSLSLVTKNLINQAEAKNLQKSLLELASKGGAAVVARRNDRAEFVYDLHLPDYNEKWIGRFSINVNNDLWNIKRSLAQSKARGLPKEIRHLKLFGITTFAIRNDEGNSALIETLVEDAQQSGMWCTPIIIGFPTLFF